MGGGLDLFHRVGKWFEASLTVFPERYVARLSDDGPDAPVTRRHGLVCGRWFGGRVRVRMVIANNVRSAGSRSPVRIDQRLRIDLEMCFGRGVHIGSGRDAGDVCSFAEKDAAAFARDSGAGSAHHIGQNNACHAYRNCPCTYHE